MESFEDELEKLREAGIGLGLDDEQIDHCMVEALKSIKRTQVSRFGQNPNDDQRNTGNQGRTTKENTNGDTKAKTGKSRTCCGYFVQVTVTLLLLCTCFYWTVSYCPVVQIQVMKVLEPHAYSINRMWRFITLPLSRAFDLTGLYEDECLVDNPFLRRPPVLCDEYQHADTVDVLQDLTPQHFKDTYLAKTKIFVLRNASHRVVAYSSLRTWYRENEESFRMAGGYNRLSHVSVLPTDSSSSPLTLDHVLTNYSSKHIKSHSDFHLVWTADYVSSSRLLRKLFPRPSFITEDQEVSIAKTLFVDAPNVGMYSLLRPRHSHENMWYVQGSGSRRLFFIPRETCLFKYKPLQITVHAGDIVYAYDQFWRIDSYPLNEESDDSISVSFLGTFS